MAPWPPLAGILSFIFVAYVAANQGFVYRQGHQLMIDGKPWYFIGANAYWLWDEAKWGDKEHINDFFRYCQDYNLKVIRIWGYSHNSPKAAGVYDEFEMEMLDFIISSAGKHDIRLIIALSNFWEAYRSPEELMSLAGEEVEGKDVLDYYRSSKVKQFLKEHFRYVVSRNNTLTGLAYRDDPTIMCWTAMNEARCPGCLTEAEQRDHLAFISELSQALKDYANEQLVSTGTEGFFFDESMTKYNPGAGVRCEGEEWLKLGQLSSIDVLNAHIWNYAYDDGYNIYLDVAAAPAEPELVPEATGVWHSAALVHRMKQRHGFQSGTRNGQGSVLIFKTTGRVPRCEIESRLAPT
ncbi:glycoside hydrolase superfamily [Dunaliella salina]|uniref:mannan endo-1,4-beta-mannosidase n=1 Tax=Dunaliella salina TaxID=3046 RepID=A0ABQ7GVV1_DUNSA|nr:glycoside hydrolase superfamily [Dunaliella salina]|eukprot:KAF5838739.1 glycoside hydrolase superfamily [Dunaliella salina]